MMTWACRRLKKSQKRPLIQELGVTILLKLCNTFVLACTQVYQFAGTNPTKSIAVQNVTNVQNHQFSIERYVPVPQQVQPDIYLKHRKPSSCSRIPIPDLIFPTHTHVHENLKNCTNRRAARHILHTCFPTQTYHFSYQYEYKADPNNSDE